MQEQAPLSRSRRLRRPGGLLGLVSLCALPLLGSDVQAASARHAGTTAAPPSASSCSDACDKKASDCVDACEDKFKEDKPRVQCKMTCIGDREKCEKDCK